MFFEFGNASKSKRPSALSLSTGGVDVEGKEGATPRLHGIKKHLKLPKARAGAMTLAPTTHTSRLRRLCSRRQAIPSVAIAQLLRSMGRQGILHRGTGRAWNRHVRRRGIGPILLVDLHRARPA